MRVLKVYLDTSVIGGCFDEEFSVESLMLIDRIKSGRYIALISDTTLKELEGAPTEIKNVLKGIPEEYQVEITTTPEVRTLAQMYITEKVVPQWCQVDALHIATAAHFGADLLLSWNFKHIVNVFRIRGYNSVNLKLGYSQIEIRSPKDIIDYETGK